MESSLCSIAHFPLSPVLCAGKMHPFGKEEAASVSQQFGFFCECLKRGEWELAQASVPQLHRGHGDIPKKVEEILQALVACPSLMRCGQYNSPQRLAWIWLLTLEKWLEWNLILDLQSTPMWSDWQTLKRCCADNPPVVMDLILEAKEYELCEEWGCLYPIPGEHLISLNQKHPLYLLESGDHEKALQLLQRISDPTMRLDVTERSLDQHPSLAASHFLANYLTTHFYGELTATRHYEIQALYVGSKSF
ncbi:zinc finger FYVE domain-containing protein 26-like [Trichosurus vulpecula]|uniref:zinc finger FYVE domain-containing protein 26-like n=1 Tax=Trichosurus vulpecula TaxID=9337 RepID=UPI00186B1DF4|nr:zinc finger FYVE domain-containing protein 26-like [Trichosurus vulpecula]